MFQFHDEGQSPYLYKFEDNQWLWFESKSLLRIDLGKQTETLQINKSNHTCDEGRVYGRMSFEQFKKIVCVCR